MKVHQPDLLGECIGYDNLENALKEKEIDATVTTTKTINWGAYVTFEYTVTGAVTFSDSNLPTGVETHNITIVMTGDFALTWPSYWEFSGDTYDGTIENLFACEVVDGDTSNERVVCTISNLT